MIDRLIFELQDAVFFRARYIIYLAAAAMLVLLSGWLIEGQVPLNVMVFTDGMTAEESSGITSTLELIPSAVVVATDAPLTAEALRQNDAVLGIGKAMGKFVAVENSASGQDGYLARFLRGLPHIESATDDSSPFNPVAVLATVLAVPESANLLVDAGRRPFLPAMIGLLTIFAPFLLAIETYGRQRDSGLLWMSIAAGRGATLPALAARFIVSLVGGLLLLVVLLAVARAAFGAAQDSAWPQILLWYLPAAVFSAALGSAVALWTGGARVLGSSAGYLFALVVFGGVFVPVAASAPLVQWISTVVPTRYFLPVLRRWMFEGQLPSLVESPALTILQRQSTSEMQTYLVVAGAALVLVLASAALTRRTY